VDEVINNKMPAKEVVASLKIYPKLSKQPLNLQQYPIHLFLQTFERACREYAANIQGSFGDHLRNIQGTRSEHEGNI
jgi:hypothetical protein